MSTLYSLYIIKCSENNKVYIGWTAKQNPYDRFITHLDSAKKTQSKTRKFYCAINKYGADTFSFEVILQSKYQDEIKLKEKYFIKQYDSFKNGYNMTEGGDGGIVGAKRSKKCRKTMSIAQKLSCKRLVGMIGTRAKTYKITKITGEIINWKSLNNFAKMFNYNPSNLHEVCRKIRSHHKDVVAVEVINV